MHKPIETAREVCYKKVLMTDDEYNEYKNICAAYDTPTRKGETLFIDSFESNESGRIVYIKALGERQSSFEVIFFLFSLMQNQWLRAMMSEVNIELKKVRAKNKILDNKIKEVDRFINVLEKKVPVKVEKVK